MRVLVPRRREPVGSDACGGCASDDKSKVSWSGTGHESTFHACDQFVDGLGSGQRMAGQGTIEPRTEQVDRGRCSNRTRVERFQKTDGTVRDGVQEFAQFVFFTHLVAAP